MGSKILMVEHDPDDRWLTVETFQAEGISDGVEFIYGADLEDYIQDPDNRPPLIILNMNAQPFNGMDLVRQIRDRQGFETVPIVVLSESALPDVVQAAYTAGATSFILKPGSYNEALFKIKSFINYWFRTVVLPS